MSRTQLGRSALALSLALIAALAALLGSKSIKSSAINC